MATCTRTTPLSDTDVRGGASVACLKQAIQDHLMFSLGKMPPGKDIPLPAFASPRDCYTALALAVRDRLVERWSRSMATYLENPGEVRAVAYLSAEFLIGPQLGLNLMSLDLTEAARQAVTELGLDFDRLAAIEPEPGLGNGGLGRLAACFMESLASLTVPAIGYGIHYEFGLFRQVIKDGWQVEHTDKWLMAGNPWELVRPEAAVEVGLGGHTESFADQAGNFRVRWVPGRVVRGVACDIPIAGYRVPICNTLRLWKAEAVDSFDFEDFTRGDYLGAVHEKVFSETISKVLYPSDEPPQGRQLRLAQQYFFVACSLADMLRVHLAAKGGPETFDTTFSVQLNDTHPALAVAELMRLLVDVHDLPWETAWGVVERTFGYTNHTLLPEALEEWPVDLFGQLLPRHLQIVFEINRRFLDLVRLRFPGDEGKVRRLSLVNEDGGRSIRMAHLAAVGSKSVNGVAALHTELLKSSVMRDFFHMYPERFSNKTNGVNHRRFLALANPALAACITEAIGDGWLARPDELARLEDFARDKSFLAYWRRARQTNKERLAELIREHTGLATDPASLFDIQVKRIHEYKRQHLNVLHILTLYNRLKADPNLAVPPRTFIFGGKAAPSYHLAKRIIRLITGTAELINADPAMRGKLAVAFLPDFNVKLAQHIYPAADLSEQISLAGKEASGTGNMKFALNGALTMGTLDGANVEIRERVGAENFFLFGLTAEEVAGKLSRGYDPGAMVRDDEELARALALIGSGAVSRGDAGLFRPILDSLYARDPYLVLADYRGYVGCQEEAGRVFADHAEWSRRSVLQTARTAYFSSDRTIAEYCRDIWQAGPVAVGGK